MKWRVYRLPGSQAAWHVDSGPGTIVINLAGIMSDVPMKSVNNQNSNQQPRFWVEIEGNLFVGRNGVGRFMSETATLLVCKTISDEELERLTAPESKQKPEIKPEVN